MVNPSPQWIYIAGPYTLGDPVQNTRTAIDVADRMAAIENVVPIVPHLSLLWDMVHPKQPGFWYEYTFELLKRCDAVYRIPGQSSGADDEVAYAAEMEMPVFYDWSEFMKWLKHFA